MSEVRRMTVRDDRTSPVHGTPAWKPVKSLWYTAMLLVALVLAPGTFTWSTGIMCGLLTAFTLCFGHSVGLHRLLVHRSFKCPLWLEYCMVYTGVLVGMGGPRSILYMHDIRDWSQRHPDCHAFYIHKSPIWKDWWWNLHCELKLDHPPVFKPEARVAESAVYRWMERYWMLTQLPLAIVLFAIGGLPWLVWGIAVRIAVSLTGHWLVGHIAHKWGRQPWIVDGAAVQGYNVHGLGLITMGEAWHNNHHAFPESARLGLEPFQFDAGWLLVSVLRRIGFIWDVKVPEDLPEREALRRNEEAKKLEQPELPSHVGKMASASM